MSSILSRLRDVDVGKRIGDFDREVSRDALKQFQDSGVKFVASHPQIEEQYYRAAHDLMNNIYTAVNGSPLLIEGDVYIGCWLESTGTIKSEHLSRFCPQTARSCFELFADFQREDGLIPYKVTDQGPYYRQIQMVTPLARSVWNHYLTTGRDKAFLEKMYNAIARNDQWLSVYRNTRGTGCVEAFCTFDTGHDRSARFWHVNDIPFEGDPAKYDPDSPVLPYLAPDLTSNVYCQRKYLQKMAEELGKDGSVWAAKAEQSLKSLMEYCYDEEDRFFYDRDRNNRFVRMQSIIQMYVFANEVGDGVMFEDALKRYLLNTQKFFARYPLTAIALDQSGYDHNSIYYNSWSGKSSHLTTLRTPHAFEYHHRYVELSWIIKPILSHLSRNKKFSGAINPWTGEPGESKNFSGAMLCLLDYLERYSGILPTPEGDIWFTTLIPYGEDYGQTVAEATGYARKMDGAAFELVNDKAGSEVYKDGNLLYSIPQGVRVVTDRNGALKGLIGMSVRTITGQLRYKNQVIPFSVSGNERLEYTGTGFVSVENPGIVMPHYEKL
jgi:hypothetical protein